MSAVSQVLHVLQRISALNCVCALVWCLLVTWKALRNPHTPPEPRPVLLLGCIVYVVTIAALLLFAL